MCIYFFMQVTIAIILGILSARGCLTGKLLIAVSMFKCPWVLTGMLVSRGRGTTGVDRNAKRGVDY